MRQIVIALVGAISLAAVTLSAQSNTVKTKSYVPPRAADGHADISGVWAHNAATPLERPQELADRAMLTDEEVQQLTETANELFDGDGDAAFGEAIYMAALANVLGKQKGFTRGRGTGDYNSFWLVGRWFENRTSLLTDPPNGKLPPMTTEATARRARSANSNKPEHWEGPEDVGMGVRCITGYVPMMSAGYNSYYEITQAPSAVAVNMEMRHDTRAIAITDRKHVPSDVRLWLGDPIGRWEGDTFVVDSTNFRGDNGFRVPFSEKLHLIEKFSRVADDTLKYEVIIDDPGTYTKPWTAVLFMRKANKEQVYEFACHEGNHAMVGTLRGQRVQEQKAREKAQSSGAVQQR